ncbi:transmembrane protein 19-like [Patiria miniata]|uniref:Transmembrane protein 19 n=1 Tax=Patiria miniata TaxID=46514 RepID=A0A913ZCV0_PATMI|nr:transmembrane protein 19-like [Patiria miniata]
MMLFGALLSVIVPLSLLTWAISMLGFTYMGSEAPIYPISPGRWLLTVTLPLFLAISGLRKKSVTSGGAILGYLVGFTMLLASYSFFMALLAFFYTASKATRFKAEMKKKIEADYKEGGQRDWLQVISNGGIPTSLAIIYVVDSGFRDLPLDFRSRYDTTWTALALMSAYACCCGDTWASEIGTVMGSKTPRLITTLSKVPVGTNGAVSFVGLLSSAVGGFMVGCGFYIGLLISFSSPAFKTATPQWPVMVFAALAGLVGSLIDSLLGALFQYSALDLRTKRVVSTATTTTEYICGWPVLDNNGVNMLSSLLTSMIMPGICFAWWPAGA